MRTALLTTYLAPYRVPLYARLAQRHGVEVLCFGGGGRYVPPWFADLDEQLREAPFPARRLHGVREALTLGNHYDTVIAGFAGGAIFPAAYVSARRHRRPFVLWASVWAQPRSFVHALALPATRHIYRHADAVIAYGEHVRRFVGTVRGRDDDVFVAPQAVEPMFSRPVTPEELSEFRRRHRLGAGPLVLYVGRLVAEKGITVLLAAWRALAASTAGRARRGTEAQPTLVLIGDGALAAEAAATPRARLLGALPRERLPVAYAAAELAVLPAVPTPRFREPWGLVCNEAMHQGRPVLASSSVGAVAGGLVRDEETGLVVAPGDPAGLRGALERLLDDAALRARLGAAARTAVAAYDYDAMAAAFDRALEAASAAAPARVKRSASRPARGSQRSSRWRTRRRT